MAKLWEHSGLIERDANDNRCVAATAEFFVGGTTTPFTVYEDAAETTPHTDPVEADGNGRWPMVIVPFCTSYDVKVSTAGGTQLYYYRELPNPDPVEAAADTVDDEQLIQTGDIIFSPKFGTRSGFVRVNGRTIGSASSGASERANADCSDLYAFIWNNFANGICAVTGGRGGSAAADFAANKAIALMDGRGCGLRGLDDMGNSAGSFLTLATFTTGDSLTGGSIAGVNSHALTEAQLANHTHVPTVGGQSADHSHTGTTGGQSVSHSHNVSGTTGDESASHTHGYLKPTFTFGAAAGADQLVSAGTTNVASNADSNGHTHAFNVSSGNASVDHSHTFSTSGVTADHTHSVSLATTGSGTAHNNVPRSILGNLLMKL